MKKYILLFVFIILNYTSNAQTGIGTTTPDISSALDIRIANKGVLLSRVALTGTTDITTIPSPANSLLVYNTATIADLTPGYYYWDTAASKWIRILDAASTITGWGLNGNAYTDPATDFIGTTDDVDLVFKRNNLQAGRLSKFNTSLGQGSLRGTGSYNTAFGNKALGANTGGTLNTATGFEALGSNLDGNGNAAFGYRALNKLAQGKNNVSVGMYSSDFLSEGSGNTVVGASALAKTYSGNYNIAIGSGAGYRLKMSGNEDGFNTIIGSYDNHNTQGFDSGRNNTILGSRIKDLPSSLVNNIIIADGSGNRRINVNATGNVGLGTNDPDKSAALDVTSTNKGVLLPRVALTGVTDATTIPSPANSLMIYNTATSSDVTPGYYFWNTSNLKWMRVLDSDSSGWNTKGNSGTAEGTDFIGTTDNINVVFKRKNIHAGLLSDLNAHNTSFGVNSYKGTTSGTQGIRNTAIGSNSLHGNSEAVMNGNDNTALGYNSLSVNDTGNENVAVGVSALKSNTAGDNNTAIGFSSLTRNTTGRYNVANGAHALERNTEGASNIAIGGWALSNNQKGNDNIAIGVNSLSAFNQTGAYNIGLGSSALKGNSSGELNVGVGYEALSKNFTGYNNTAIGAHAGTSLGYLKNTTAIGFRASVNESNAIQLGNGDITKISGQVGFSTTSDRRYKKDIKTIPLGLDFINKVRPVEYIRKNNESNTKEWGVIAQELQQTLDEVAYKDAGVVQEGGDADKMLSVRYTDLIAPMIKSIQELTEQNNKLKRDDNLRNERLEKENKLLNDRINQLEIKLEKRSKN